MERKGARGHGKAEQGGRKDRRSATGMNGEPKKGGHGGKFTWAGDQRHSKAEYGEMEKGAVDSGDPNFEDPEQAEEEASSRG